MINKQADYHMYLNAAHQPTEEHAKNTEVKSTEADVKLNAPYLEMMNTIKSLETQLNQKIDNLRQKGVQGIIEEKMEKTLKSSQPEAPNVSYPEDRQPISQSVVSVREVKTKPRKRPKSEILPILARETKSKYKKKNLVTSSTARKKAIKGDPCWK